MKNYALQRSGKAGFTFIEVLLALFIVSLMVTYFLEGMVVANKWIHQARQKTTATYVALSVLEYVSSEEGQEILGWGKGEELFQFNEEIIRDFNLPEDMEVMLYWEEYAANMDLWEIYVRVKWLTSENFKEITMCTLQEK